jgi:cyclopropane fatty-acyl-phospholipid synthase-like methyltransferase
MTREQIMETCDPVDLLFGGMEKLGPGSNADTQHVLSLLPRSRFDLVVDAGCGSGRQTMVLARQLGTLIHAVDLHGPFLQQLEQRSRQQGIGHLVRSHRMDMQDIPEVFTGVDLLWCEGAAYNIGFGNALTTWAAALKPDGFAVVSELCWLDAQPSAAVQQFFQTAYPAMQSLDSNTLTATNSGYRVLGTHILSRAPWVEGYYQVLEPRAKLLLNHPDSAVRDSAQETVREIEVFQNSEETYGYVFYILQRAG